MSDSFDRVVRAAARRSRAVDVCPDAGTLAAYLDSGLTSEERAAVEAHAADCARCQEHLALLGAVSVERPDPEAAAARPWLVRWGWLVPVATAVLVVAVWTRTPGPVDAPAQMPRREAAPAVIPAPAPFTPAEPAPEQRSVQPEQRSAPAGAAKSERARERQDAARQTEGLAAHDQASPVAPPADAPEREADRRGQFADAAGQTAEDKAAQVAEAAPTPAAPALRSEAQLMRKAAALPIEAATSAGERYRAVGGTISRSSDAGATWREIVADASLAVTAAACAPEGPCWFGTSTGVVLRIAGDRVERSRLPETEPITAVVATPPTDVVVTAGSRRYRQTGSSTWVPIP